FCHRDIGTKYTLPIDVDSAANAIMATRSAGAEIQMSFRTPAGAPAVSNTILGNAGAGINWGTSGGGNVLIGDQVAESASSMGQGVAIGYKSFETGMGARNTAIGNYTGTFSGNNVTDNVFVGDGAAYSFSASSRSVCLGG